MTSIVRWDLFQEIEHMRETMDRLFAEFRPFRWVAPGVDGSVGYGYFPVDIRETPESFEVTAALPGVRPEDVDIQVQGDSVTIKGESREEREEKDAAWLRRERRYGAFQRSFTLPARIDADKAVASYEHGLLRLRLPKSEEVRPKVIKVSGGQALEGEARSS